MTDNGITVDDWGTIQIKQFSNASKTIKYIMDWSNAKKIPYSKYNIKESDMRIKTATFSSPQYLDLTTGLFAIRIVSKYHENFAGLVLDVTYNEKTGIYDYQCQDFSRFYISQNEIIVAKKPIWKILMALITQGKLKIGKKMSRRGYENILSGFRGLSKYNQSLYPNQHYKGNPFTKNISLIARDKPTIEVIRDLVFSSKGYFDVYFNERGILQIEPLSKTDWENTGLHLSNQEFSERKFKFSTTNAISGVRINGTDNKGGKTIWSDDVLNKLNLSAFFGNITTSIANPIQTSSSAKSTSNATNTNQGTINKNNPYGTKNKEVWVNMDDVGGRTQDLNYLNKVCELLRKNGWKVHNMGRGPNIHTLPEYFYQCKNGIWWTIDGGMDPGTIRHLGYDNWCAGHIMRNGGRTVFACMMDNTKKYWVEKGCDNFGDLHTAHDWGKSIDTYLKWPAGYMAWSGLPFMTAKNHDAEGMVAQFLKGGCSQEALKMSNWKNHKGNYSVQSGWTSKY